MDIKLVETIKEEVQKPCLRPDFIHHKWYLQYHLKIVEKISLDLCQKYQNAEPMWVLLLVWMHDFEKIVRHGSQYQGTLGREFLKDCGVSDKDINKLLSDIEIFERKNSLKLVDATLEIKIVSSADAAAHLVGPFYSIFWWENGAMEIEDLRKANLAKLKKGWEEKIVLPEIKKAYENYYNFFQDNFLMKIPPLN